MPAEEVGVEAVAITVAVMTVVFTAMMPLWYFIAKKYHPRFAAPEEAPIRSEPLDEEAAVESLPPFDRATQADFCSRVNSTLHCIVVVIGLIIALPQVTYDPATLTPTAGDSRPILILFAFSFAYFLVDLVVVVAFCVPLWPAFAIHHVAAMLALGGNIFNTECRVGSTLCLGVFLLVEIATIPLNVEVFAEQLGADAFGLVRTVFFYATVVSWFLTRVGLPLAVDVLLFTRVSPSLPWPTRGCLIPGMISAVYLTGFCIVVFFIVLLRRVKERWMPAPQDAPLGSTVVRD